MIRKIAILSVALVTALTAAAAVATLRGPDRAAAEDAKPAAKATATSSAQAQAKDAGYASVRIEGVPHVKQLPDFCGEACVEMAMRKLGREATQKDVFNASGLDPLQGRGCYTKELAAAMRSLGLKVGPVGQKVEAAKAGEQLEALWRGVHADLVAGVASVLCMHYDDRPKTTEHFRLVVGYDAKTDEVLYHEPAESGGAYRRMKRATMMKLWPLKYEAVRWTVICLRCEPASTDWTAPAKPSGTFTAADYAQHMMGLKEKIPKTGFATVLEPPFVVVGDEPAAKVRQRAAQTVRWAVVRLKKQFFAKEPDEILTIWLFKDKESYRKHTKEIFGDEPSTPFGYYSPRHKALVMNIATGGGTLVHEIVHPFMRGNFEACPAWFNEGLASLYEQSAGRGNRIVGLTNWRLAGLQEAIRNDRLPTFKALTATSEHQFYNMDSGSNYAQARYLCYWLQEKGLLERYYREFTAAAADDPTGYKTLQKVLGESDMEAFQARWQAWVLTLAFP
ncbi:MAG: C39 family peptidase [Planctomycetes bacterium]|nr:C39 family peptidase [Planctomycetota bacterium]